VLAGAFLLVAVAAAAALAQTRGGGEPSMDEPAGLCEGHSTAMAATTDGRAVSKGRCHARVTLTPLCKNSLLRIAQRVPNLAKAQFSSFRNATMSFLS
jgi:hypothetical protein